MSIIISCTISLVCFLKCSYIFFFSFLLSNLQSSCFSVCPCVIFVAILGIIHIHTLVSLFYSFEFSHQFHLSLSDSKSPGLFFYVNWLQQYPSSDLEFPRFFSKLSETDPRTRTAIGFSVTFMFYVFVSPLLRPKYLFIFSVFKIF